MKKLHYSSAIWCLFFLIASSFATRSTPNPEAKRIAAEMEEFVRATMLSAWYPQAIDREYGGFLSHFLYDFEPGPDQRKMIVTQARHTWTNAQAAMRYDQEPHYWEGAKWGYEFLRDKMWDKTYGGFFTLVDRQGKPIDEDQIKTAYGNSFGIFALAAYYKATKDQEALNLAIEAFNWLEKHSHDPEYGGYFQHLARDGSPIVRTADVPSTSDLGYKDQNSSIHLLEAFTELYQVWPDPQLRIRLSEMLLLIRDKMVDEKGFLRLFYEADWTPVSFHEEDRTVILAHKQLDHVSYGHDVETAFLLWEAAHVLGREVDTYTLKIAKKMVDHALDHGWDAEKGGFYDEGYYFSQDAPSVIKMGKNWWAQSEALNTLALMHVLYPEDERDYWGKFKKLWEYYQEYLIDEEFGDVYSGGLDLQPEMKTGNKGHLWKASYHQFRGVTHAISLLKKMQ
ncbi:AGE family epimerase/isomerase [Pararhodonellum marinum]|uniref:AGE family epimerase/isomerase n=1 Tax=Pararhodonellum marinum TaxID=2755358 RepID=UPI00188F951A|nr:AGE family epimerase/isomerase [Pararhodonellum marinum]